MYQAMYEWNQPPKHMTQENSKVKFSKATSFDEKC